MFTSKKFFFFLNILFFFLKIFVFRCKNFFVRSKNLVVFVLIFFFLFAMAALVFRAFVFDNLRLKDAGPTFFFVFIYLLYVWMRDFPS